VYIYNIVHNCTYNTTETKYNINKIIINNNIMKCQTEFCYTTFKLHQIH
jgi:hypothetical protein